MSASYKFERSVLGHDEFETIRVTHHPGIYDLTNTDLRDIQIKLRKMRDKERSLSALIIPASVTPAVPWMSSL